MGDGEVWGDVCRGFIWAVTPKLFGDGFAGPAGAGELPAFIEPNCMLLALACGPELAPLLTVKEGFLLCSLDPGAFRTLLPFTIVGAPPRAGTAGVTVLFPFAVESGLFICTAADPPFAMIADVGRDAFGEDDSFVTEA